MDAIVNHGLANSREQLVYWLYEAAELEHNLMCTYLYAAFSLKSGEQEGLSRTEAAAVGRWRRSIIQVATEEMGHLAAVWNITSALGAAPRIGRMNFPLDVGYLPAGIVDRLVEVAHACPSGAIRYARRDGQPDEAPPPVKLAPVREAGPFAFRGELRLAGEDPGYLATLCRCGGSQRKPFCDGTHAKMISNVRSATPWSFRSGSRALRR